jgi:hypothetical protein
MPALSQMIMGKSKAYSSQEIAALIRKWERVGDESGLLKVAVQTAAFLSRVNDVPCEVLNSLDRLMAPMWRGHGNALYVVVKYLRDLEQIDALLAS